MTRIWIDGCFDLFHHGVRTTHANAIRQASAFGSVLVAGVHSNEEITAHKGPPVLDLEERCALVKACRWVDEIVPGAPYVTEVDFVKQYGIDYVVHGDDVTTDADGHDTYRHVKVAGMYKECKRTEGVSTTDAISRVLDGVPSTSSARADSLQFRRLLIDFSRDRRHPDEPNVAIKPKEIDAWQSVSVTDFLTDPSEIHSTYVSRGARSSPEAEFPIIVAPYDGFTLENLDMLEQEAVKSGGVIAGILSDEDILRLTGRPAIFSLQERALSVLQCRHVTGVIVPFTPAGSPPASPSALYERIERQRPLLEARQARKLGKSILEVRLAQAAREL